MYFVLVLCVGMPAVHIPSPDVHIQQALTGLLPVRGLSNCGTRVLANHLHTTSWCHLLGASWKWLFMCKQTEEDPVEKLQGLHTMISVYNWDWNLLSHNVHRAGILYRWCIHWAAQLQQSVRMCLQHGGGGQAVASLTMATLGPRWLETTTTSTHRAMYDSSTTTIILLHQHLQWHSQPQGVWHSQMYIMSCFVCYYARCCIIWPWMQMVHCNEVVAW